MLQGSLARCALALFSCAYVMAVAHATGIDDPATPVEKLFVVDVDGDFKADIAWQGVNANNEHRVSGDQVVVQHWRDGHLLQNWSQNDANWVLGDFNGDARSDWLLQGKTALSTSTLVLTQNDNKVGRIAQSIPYLNLGLQWDAQHHKALVGDFNGDNRDDIFLQGLKNSDRHAVAFSDANGAFNSLAFDFDDAHLNLDWAAQSHDIIVGHFDNDGVSDALLQGKNGQSHAFVLSGAKPLSTLGQQFENGALGLDFDAQNSKILAGDFDGDYWDDVLVLALDNQRPSYFVKIANGALQQLSGELPAIANIAQLKQALVGDFNSDGIDEVVLLFHGEAAPMLLQQRGGASAHDIALRLQQAQVLRADQLKQVVSVTPNQAGQVTGVGLDTGASANNATDAQRTLSAEPALMTTALAETCSGTVGVDCPYPATAVGTTTGQAGVSGGAASYSIPIALPPGRSGMQPSVSLSYSSRAGNGIAGMGWSLDAGQSSISRCPNTVAQDGFTRGVMLDAQDKLCLDGQRLTKITGTYGLSGAIYRTELETFVRVTQSGAMSSTSSSFTLEQADGHKRYYSQSMRTASTSAPQTWLMTRSEDAHGNSLMYEYSIPVNGVLQAVGMQTTGFSSSEALLTKIYYTGVASTPGNRYVAFDYGDRDDRSQSFLAGGETQQTKRLITIRTFDGSKSVRRYQLGYQKSAATGRSLLNWAQECAASYCLPAVQIQWHSSALEHELVKLQLPDYDAQKSLLQQGSTDSDGDGVRDTFYYTPNAGWRVVKHAHDGRLLKSEIFEYSGASGTVQRQTPSTFTLDVNMDGRGDLADVKSGNLVFLISNGHGYTELPAGIPWPMGLNQQLIGDLSGDGIVDALTHDQTAYDGGATDTRVYLNKSCRGSSPLYCKKIELYNPVDSWYLVNSNREWMNFGEKLQPAGDIDGNGLQDFWIETTTAEPYPLISFYQIRTGVLLIERSATGTISVSKKSLADINFKVPLETVNSAGALKAHYLQDINGDGLADVVFADGGTWKIQLNNGKAYGPIIETGSDLGIAHICPINVSCGEVGNGVPVRFWTGTRAPLFHTHVRWGDFDSDGKSDLLIPVEESATYCVRGKIKWSDGSTLDDCWLNRTPQLQNNVYRWDYLRFVKTATAYRVEQQHSSIEATLQNVQIGDMFGEGQDTVYSGVGFWHTPNPIGDEEDGGYYEETSTPGQTEIDVAPFSGAGVYVNRKSSGLTDIVSSVENGLQIKNTWTYAPLSDFDQTTGELTRYTPDYDYLYGGAADNQHMHFTSSMLVASDFKQSNGSDEHSASYRYVGAIYDYTGRGFQGFRQIIEERNVGTSKALRTTTTFHQKFPHAGTVERQEITRISDGKKLSETVNQFIGTIDSSWSCSASISAAATADLPVIRPFSYNATYLPYISQSISRTFNPDSAGCEVLSTSLSTLTKSDFGNDSPVISKVKDAYQTLTTTHTRVFDESNELWSDKLNSDKHTKTVTYVDARGATNLNPAALTTAYTWTAKRQLKTQKATLEDGRTLTTTHTYDYESPVSNSSSYGNLVKTNIAATPTTDIVARDTQSITAFSTDGYFPATIKNALGHTSTLSTDAASGLPLSATDPNGVISTIKYDAFGRVIEKDTNLSATPETTEYLTCGGGIDCTGLGSNATLAKYAIKVQRANGNSHLQPPVTTYFDAMNRPLRSETVRIGGINGTRAIVDTVYDNFGRVQKTSAPWNGIGNQYWTTFDDYDVLDRPASKTLPNGETRTGLKIKYDYQGLTTKVTVNDGGTNAFTISRTKNALGQWLQTIDQGDDGAGVTNAVTTDFRYDANGAPVLIAKKSGAVEVRNTATYNNVGHKLTMTDPEKGAWSFAYNTLGELTSQTDAKAQVTGFSYDLLGRPLTRTEAGTKRAEWTYDTGSTLCLSGGKYLGQLSTATRFSSVAAVEYKRTLCNDSFARGIKSLHALTGSGEATRTYALSQTFDPENRVTTSTAPYLSTGSAVLTIKNDYDVATGLLNKLTDTQTNSTLEETVLMDVFGNPQQTKLNQQNASTPALYEQRFYDKCSAPH